MVFLDLGTLRNAQILQEPIKSLCAAIGLHGAIHLLQEFSDGFSETRVVLGEQHSGPDDLQPFRLVFKVGAADALRDEVSRYLDFVAHARAKAAFVPIWKAETTLNTLPNDGSLAAIAYGHAGDVFGAQDCVAFKDVFRECIRGKRPVSEVASIIESLSRIMGSLYAEPTRSFAPEVALYYLEHWAPDYQVVADHLVDTGNPPLLTLQRLNPEHFRYEPASIAPELRKLAESRVNGSQPDITLPRCTVAEVGRERLVLWVNSADDLTLHVDVKELPRTSRASISQRSIISLWAPRKISRYDFYLRQVRLALPSLDVEATSFQAGPLWLHNPLIHFSAPLLAATRPPAFTLTVPGHGDLHPGNVLVAGSTPVIIDYGKSVTRIPMGVDAARFFGGLVRDVLAAELSFDDLAIVLGDTLGLGTPAKEADSPAYRAATLLKLIAEKLIPTGAPESRALWPAHLYGYAWIGLKWPSSPPESYRACVLLAGMALHCLLGSTPTMEESMTAALGSVSEEKPVPPITAPRPIRPEGPAEILILVSQFDGSADYDPTVRIYSTLADQVFEILPSLARVERIEEVISSRKDAIAMAERYRASMIVWGTFDNLGISPHYEVTRDSLVMKRSMIQLDQATRHQLSERFEPYVTQNLAAEISFLSLKAVAEMCELNLNFDDALRVYNRILSLIPDRERALSLGAAEIYRSLAALYFVLNRDKEAIEANDKAREIDPGDFITELQGLQIRSRIEKKSDIQQIKALKSLLRARLEADIAEPEEREALQEVLTKLEPLHTSADLRKLIAAESPKTALPISEAMNKSKQFQKDVMVHLKRAEELVNNDKYQKSLSEIRAALRLNPRCVEALTLRASVLAGINRVEEALKDLEKAEKLNPTHYQLYLARGSILVASFEDYQGALQQFEKAFELNMPKPLSIGPWGEAMIELGRGEEAMRLVRGWNLDPSDPRLFTFRSQYYRKKGNYEVALREASQAVQLSDRKWAMEASLRERAEVYEAMGRRGLAIQDLEQAIKYTTEGTFSMRKIRQRLNELRSFADTTADGPDKLAAVPDSQINSEPRTIEQEREPDV